MALRLRAPRQTAPAAAFASSPRASPAKASPSSWQVRNPPWVSMRVSVRAVAAAVAAEAAGPREVRARATGSRRPPASTMNASPLSLT
eukprot:scaffold18130_cov32-Tisochrysis_lutea.AAC.1